MKTLFLLLTVSMLMVVTSCQKDESVAPEKPAIKFEQLVGDWKFQSMDGVALTCEQIRLDMTLNQNEYVKFDLSLKSDNGVVLYDECTGKSNPGNFEFTPKDSILICGTNSIKFKILSISANQLKMKSIYEQTTYFPTAGKTYVLTK